eukprot:164155-Prymnesium_polylepis.1
MGHEGRPLPIGPHLGARGQEDSLRTRGQVALAREPPHPPPHPPSQAQAAQHRRLPRLAERVAPLACADVLRVRAV